MSLLASVFLQTEGDSACAVRLREIKGDDTDKVFFDPAWGVVKYSESIVFFLW